MVYRVLFIFRFLEFHMPCLDLRISNCGTDVDFTSRYSHHVMMPKKTTGWFHFHQGIYYGEWPPGEFELSTTFFQLCWGTEMTWNDLGIGKQHEAQQIKNNTRYMAFTMLETQQLENKNGHFSFEVSNLTSFHRLFSVAMWDFFWVPCLHEDVPWICCPSSGVDMSLFVFSSMFKKIRYIIYDDM